jgi:hypothetical protein
VQPHLRREVQHAVGQAGQPLPERVERERDHGVRRDEGQGQVEPVGVAQHEVGVGLGHLAAAPPHGQQRGRGLPVRRQQDGDARARLQVALVAQEVGRLRRPVRGGDAGQLDPLPGGVVVERDQGAGGGAVEQGVGEGHPCIQPAAPAPQSMQGTPPP